MGRPGRLRPPRRPAKDLIIRGGHNIDPAVIEGVLLAHPAVTAAQAVGRPDLTPARPVAFVALAPAPPRPPRSLRLGLRPRARAGGSPQDRHRAGCTVTLVGKPFKPALRAEATREAVADALRDIPAVTGVRAAVEDGAVVAVVDRPRGAARRRSGLDRFAIT